MREPSAAPTTAQGPAGGSSTAIGPLKVSFDAVPTEVAHSTRHRWSRSRRSIQLGRSRS